MWRAVWQRLGLGYTVLLLALAFLGGAVQSSLEVVSLQLAPMLEECLGRSMQDSDNLNVRVILWLASNSPTVVYLFILPWWIGAWMLLRSREPANTHTYWQIVFAVNSIVILFLGFIIWCCAVIVRSLYLGRYVDESRLANGVTIVLGCFVFLSFVAAFRLRPKMNKQ